jgi:hypothetical protein
MADSRIKHSDRRRRGGSSIEYMLVLTFCVIPLALLTPLILHMINLYSDRIIWSISLPFGLVGCGNYGV